MNRVFLVCGVVALLAAGCTARSSGAPDEVCDDPLMRPSYHIDNMGAAGVNNTDEYSLTSEPVADRPGVYKVTLSGPVFKGFVVRAATPGETNNGQFLTDPEATEFNTMTCASEENVAVTHINSDEKVTVTLFYEDGNAGAYVFQVFLVCGVAVLMAAGCTAFPAGAPTSVCDDPLMAPSFHIDNFGATGVNNTNEYTLTSEPVADRPNVYKVTLSGPVFRGFVMRATTSGQKNNGKFLTDPKVKAIECASQENVAVTHTSSDEKATVTLFYEDGNAGAYVFQATVVPEISTYVTRIFEQ